MTGHNWLRSLRSLARIAEPGKRLIGITALLVVMLTGTLHIPVLQAADGGVADVEADSVTTAATDSAAAADSTGAPVQPAVDSSPTNQSARATADVQDIVFFSADAPIFLRFHILVDGLPFRQFWLAQLERGFNELDTNGDGFLSHEETQSPASSGRSTMTGRGRELLQTPNLWNADRSPLDQQLSLGELASLRSTQGRGAFQYNSSTDSAAIMGSSTMSTGSSGQNLFDQIDADGDGRLSADELRTAIDGFRKRDFDDDEAISADELQASVNLFSSFSAGPVQDRETPFVVLDRETPLTQTIAELRRRYQGTRQQPTDESPTLVGATAFQRRELGLTTAQFDQLDADANQVLDDEEIREFLKSPTPVLQLNISASTSDTNQTSIAVRPALADSAVTFRESAGIVSIVVGSVQIEVGVDVSPTTDFTEQIVQQFQSLDKDNNDYLEEEEAERSAFFKSSFSQLDADNDGKMFRKELLAAVENQQQEAASRTRLLVNDRGQDLFSILDANRNLAIGRREFLEAVRRVDLWDDDKDGKIGSDEVPQVYRLVFGRGEPVFPGFNAGRRNRNPAARTTSNQLPTAPMWFHKMDINGDGDVSRREFLGTSDQFHNYDTNGDGLLDAPEATALAVK